MLRFTIRVSRFVKSSQYRRRFSSGLFLLLGFWVKIDLGCEISDNVIYGRALDKVSIWKIKTLVKATYETGGKKQLLKHPLPFLAPDICHGRKCQRAADVFDGVLSPDKGGSLDGVDGSQ